MSSEEKSIRVKKLRITADQLVIEPTRIIIRRPGSERRTEEEEEKVIGFEEE
jgi:hypothetical protein